MASNTVRLQTNIPLIGTIKYVDFSATTNPQYSDQISLRGDFDGQPAGSRVYLPVRMEGDFQSLGIIGQREPNGNYRMLLRDPRVQILRTEDGNKKFTTVELLSGGGAAPQQPARQYGNPQTQHTTQTQATAADPKAEFDRLKATMKGCFKAAKEILEESFPEGVPGVQATAHVLFIESCKRGLLRSGPAAAVTAAPPSPPPSTPPAQPLFALATPAQIAEINGIFSKLGFDLFRRGNELHAFGVATPEELTIGNAQALITNLGSKLRQAFELAAPLTTRPPEDIPF